LGAANFYPTGMEGVREALVNLVHIQMYSCMFY